MLFILRMAVREMRASWQRLLFFFLCVAIGVAAIVALRSVIQSVSTGLSAEARSLLAADVAISTNRPWESATRQEIEVKLAAAATARTESIETATMARPADAANAVARMVELRGVQPGFPLYGTVKLEDGRPYSYELLRDNGALVRRELLAQFGLNVGDQIKIGNLTFTIRGVVTVEPGSRLGAFSLGPRVLIAHDDFARTGLLTLGSRARYEILARVPDDRLDALVQNVEQQFRDKYVNVRSYRGTEDEIGDELGRAEAYLSLVGFVILVLGGIGVWSVTRVFIQQKLKSIAVLKCVGSSSRQVMAIYVVQVVLLAAGGSLLGTAIAAEAIAAVPSHLLATLGPVSLGLTWSAVAQGLSVGMLVSLLFAIVPLLDVRHVKPLLLLRHETAARPASGWWRPSGWRARARRIDWTRVLVIALVTLALVGIAVWQAASLKAGLYVCLGFAAVAVALHFGGVGLVRLVAPLARSPWFPLRHAVMNLARPGNQTRVILLAVGVGSFFIIGVRVLQTNLLAQFSIDLRPDAPDMFLIDIQQDQADGVRAFMGHENPERLLRLIPVLRGRVTGVKGRQINLESFQDVRGRGSLGREYVVTYRDRLEPNEAIVDGALWKAGVDTQPQVSIEESIRERFQIQVGDSMRFDILGRLITARVSSVRRVDWDDARNGGFMFVFNPPALAAAPHTFIATVRGPEGAEQRARLQSKLVSRFANVSVIDVREILRTVERVVANVTFGISMVGLVALLSGVLILIGAVAMTKFQRLYETAIFKTLGATTRSVAAMVVLEYGVLGLLAGTIGSAGALVLSWALTRLLFDIPWRPAPAENLAGVALTAVLVAVVGVASSIDALRGRPLATLRAE